MLEETFSELCTDKTKAAWISAEASSEINDTDRPVDRFQAAGKYGRHICGISKGLKVAFLKSLT